MYIVCLCLGIAALTHIPPFPNHSPGCHVICLTADETIARQASGLYKGVHAYVVESLEDTTGLTAMVGKRAIEAGIAKEGDSMVVVCGQAVGTGSNNQIKVETVTAGSVTDSDAAAPVGSLARGLSFSV